jgi:asparagine synthase (glutamine-hydrolysing)
MCGIHGIISNSLSKEQINRRLSHMGELQHHRGPDDRKQNVYQTKSGLVGFGLVRLSILDLETGMQPIVCPSDQTAIICNGQIYNYIELQPEVSDQPFISRGDIEVGLHLYRKKGIDFLQHLNGMYAGAIYDPIKGKVLLFRDRFGIKPLYYTTWEDNFVFSSEIKPLLKASNRPVEINESRLATFFTYRYIPGKETMFKGIVCLPPGSFLEYDLNTGRYKVERYWEYRLDKENPYIDIDEAAEEFNRLFSDAVRIRLRSDVEVGSLLSGGIDSSAVSSLAAIQKPNIKLFTMAFDEDLYNELPHVRQFLNANKKRFGAAQLQTKLCTRQALDKLPDIIRALEEPISLGTVLPTDQVCEMAGSQLKVVLTGEGADEIFAGYRKFLVEMAAHQYEDLSHERKMKLDKLYPELNHYMAVRDNNPAKRYIQSELLFAPDELKTLLNRQIPEDLFPKDALPTLSGSEHPLNASIAFESRSRLPDYVILRLDKLSMRHSLETRTPFLDFRLAEFAATLPVDLKVNLDRGQAKFICGYSYDKYSVMDNTTAHRQKLPFTIPLANWLSDPSSLPEFLKEILLGDVVKKQGILDQGIVTKLVKRVSTKGVGPHTLVSDADRVFAVIIFTLWYNEFF